jgi:hypothetical protein
MIRKKQILLFVYDGFTEWETSFALNCIRNSERFTVKTIAMDKAVKKSAGGLSVLPDLDFIPDVDLKDICAFTTSLLILPGGAVWDNKVKLKIELLVSHCIKEGIMVAASGEASQMLSANELLINKLFVPDESHPFDFANVIRNALGIDVVPSKQLVYDGVMFG